MMTATEIYEKLYAAYGQPGWWSHDPYTVMVQAILVQNTAWASVLKVTEAISPPLTPARVLGMEAQTLEELIRPCGFCKGKAAAIRGLTAWYQGYGCDAGAVRAAGQEALRKQLLAIKGVGAETADVILVYAFHQPSFVIDAYTRRLMKRLGYSFDNDQELRRFFTSELKKDDLLYGWYHWLILEHGIHHCRKTPVCDQCPLENVCKRVE